MTITDEEIEDFLAHHGVKGQRWGQRQRVKGGRTNEQKVKTGLKIFGGVVAVAAIAGGAVYAKKKLGAKGHMPIKQLASTWPAPTGKSFPAPKGKIKDPKKFTTAILDMIASKNQTSISVNFNPQTRGWNTGKAKRKDDRDE